MTISADDITAGQAVYTKRTLRIYDWLVLGFSNRFVWKCPTAELLQHYNECISGNHLDVGVGTGYFLDRCKFPIDKPRVALMDLNENCLTATAERIARYQPETHRANILDSIELEIEPFDSIAVNYVLHCLPGTMSTKAKVFQHMRQLLTNNGVLFGATIVHDGVNRGLMARWLMNYYNTKQIFSNLDDDLEGLEDALQNHFQHVSIKTVGCVAVFSAHN